MFVKKFYIATFIISFSFIFIVGCSSTSNVSRYGGKSDSDTHKTKNVRFTSDDDETGNDLTSSKQDDSSVIHETEDDSEILPPDEQKIDIASVLKKISPTINLDDISVEKGTPKERMLMEIVKYVNTPYQYGGTSAKGIDCSGFTQSVFSKSLAIKLDRTASGQYQEGQKVNDIDDLQFGDLVFFDTSRRERPGHVGIYIGDHLFAHASTNSGVTISSLDMDYYAKRFMGGRRIEPDQFGSK
jgi:cell wall-associated NlpC family hydrolase